MSSPPVIQNMSKPRRASMNRSRGGEAGGAGLTCTLRLEAVTRLWLASGRPRSGVATDVVAALQRRAFEGTLDRAREAVAGNREVQQVVLEGPLHGNLGAIGRLQDAADRRALLRELERVAPTALTGDIPRAG